MSKYTTPPHNTTLVVIKHSTLRFQQRPTTVANAWLFNSDVTLNTIKTPYYNGKKMCKDHHASITGFDISRMFRFLLLTISLRRSLVLAILSRIICWAPTMLDMVPDSSTQHASPHSVGDPVSCWILTCNTTKARNTIEKGPALKWDPVQGSYSFTEFSSSKTAVQYKYKAAEVAQQVDLWIYI